MKRLSRAGGSGKPQTFSLLYPAADRGFRRFCSGCAWDRWSGSAAGGGASSWPPWGGLFDGEGEPAKPGEPRRGAPCHIFAETVDP